MASTDPIDGIHGFLQSFRRPITGQSFAELQNIGATSTGTHTADTGSIPRSFPSAGTRSTFLGSVFDAPTHTESDSIGHHSLPPQQAPRQTLGFAGLAADPAVEQDMFSAEALPVATATATATVQPYLWCEFRPISGCSATFMLDDGESWIQHHIDHMAARFPSSCLCWYCDYVRFPHAEYQLSREGWFRERMGHIWQHILDGDLTESNMRGDPIMVKHLDKKGVLRDRQRSAAYAFCNEIPESLGQYSYSTLAEETTGSPGPSRPQDIVILNQASEDRRRKKHKSSTQGNGRR
jgi:hypothetical protein